MVLNIKIQILLSRYFPFPPFWISLLTGLLFFNNILKYHILNDFNAGLLHVLILMNIFAFFLLKYKRYELKISQKEWQEICTFLKRKFPQYDFNDDFYCTEVFARVCRQVLSHYWACDRLDLLQARFLWLLSRCSFRLLLSMCGLFCRFLACRVSRCSCLRCRLDMAWSLSSAAPLV